jgi:class 3 adenylate cyclase/tetratricopeptide (TPR) repeat protein
LICSQCGAERFAGDKYCGECGQKLGLPSRDAEQTALVDGERKHVTVLFSDLSGYTAMSEKLDPEEIKEITSRIFGDAAQVVSKYDGFIEKFAGDAVMALFGVPRTHEDDPIRAIRAAREIHDLVENLNPELEERLGQPLSMHTGINTGLVVTGEVNLERGTHGVAGDTVNLAARLSSLSKPGEIVVGPDTHRQAEGHFSFQSLETTKIKGRTEPIQIYKVLSVKEQPRKTHRLSGLRAELIGRQEEMAQLEKAVQELHKGKGSIFAICGDAGTGKSRLVEEFKATLDLEEIQWREGHAFPYSQNTPYAPLIDLFNRAFQIEEDDPPEKIREKIESRVKDLIGEKGNVVPYIGSLFELSYPEADGVSPEFWKSRLHKAILEALSAFAQRAATVICLEDLQWADHSSLELLRFILSEFKHPVLFLCVYRPPFSLFSGDQLRGIEKLFCEIRLQDLSPPEAQNLMESLLKTEFVPLELRQFIREKVEGNPFYLEEVINSLIESETLISDNGGWRLTRSISEFGISPTIRGVIYARVDRLETNSKRILQEASVIGRTFFYEILKRVTDLKDHIDRCLTGLERLDLIKKRSATPDLEYVFKHALTQEVVYSVLLRKERQAIHERIGLVIEQLFSDRLAEFYETLAYHFTHGQSVLKAVDYLMKSGKKSLKRYAVEEAHRYYQEAFDVLSDKTDKSKDEQGLFIDLLNEWALVYYFRGDFRGLENLLSGHVSAAESLKDKERLGILYAWYGFALFCREKLRDSHHYLRKALALGEEIQNKQVIGQACTWLTWTCADLGLLEEGIHFADRAQETVPFLESDSIVFFQSLGGMGHIYFFSGESKKNAEIGNILLDHGEKHSDPRCLVVGHIDIGHGHITAGNLSAAMECYQRAVNVSEDPFYSQWPRFFLGWSYIENGQYREAEEALQGVVSFCDQYGCENLGTPASVVLGIAMLGQGRMSQGLKLIEKSLQSFMRNERKYCVANAEYILGNVYLHIAEGARPVNLSTIFRNLGFLISKLPTAKKRAKHHLKRAIELSREIGARAILGRSFLDLGLLYKNKGKTDQARECLSEAIEFLQQTEAKGYLEQAKKALQSLN